MSLFKRVQPRQDVLEGAISDDIFAASLEGVVSGTAADTYKTPEVFFAATHPSGGLKTLLNEALGRISGARPDASPVLRLETNLGGGKTHTLIALYHAARGGLPSSEAERFCDPAVLPASPVEKLAVFVGTSSGPTSFPTVDGVTPRTPWGYLALQLGGAVAYANVREDDERLTAPGSDAFRAIIGDEPALILLDELARYLTAASGVPVGSKTLADQTLAFLMALLEATSGAKRTCVVVTMTESTDPFGGDTQAMLEAFEDAKELIGRRAQAIRPSDEADLPAILRARLFDHVDSSEARAVAARYAEAMREAYSKGMDLPDRLVSGSAFQEQVEASYPFHPALIQVLDKRLSTIPEFQRTRGALRLLVRAVRLLWTQQRECAELIHVHDLDLRDNGLAEDLSSRIDRPRYAPVIGADIRSQPGGSVAHAEEVDAAMGAAYATRLATTVYLYSLTADVPGVPATELLGAVLQPGDDPGIVTKALDQLEQAAWYLHTDTRGFRFSTEWSLVKRIQEAEGRISLGKVKQKAADILSSQFRDSALKVKRTWEDPKVPDHADDAYLVLLHWDELTVDSPDDPVPAKVQELWERTPAGGNRTYRNRLVFLLPNRSGHDAMIRSVRRHLALRDLVASDLTDVSPEKRQELKNRAGESEAEARIAVCNHVNVLVVPEATGLVGYGLDQVTQASLKPNQTEAILDRLSAMEKTLTAGDKPLDPAYVQAKLGEQAKTALSTEELVRVFARRSDLKLVLDKAMLRNLVIDGIRQGVWEYQDPALGDDGWATKDRLTLAVRLAEDTLLHPVGTAPPPPDVACPLCGTVHDPAQPCPTDGRDSDGGDGEQRPPSAATFTGEGSAPVAMASAWQAAVDARRSSLRALRVTVAGSGDGMGQQLARLHTLVPAGPPTELTYGVNVEIDLGDPRHRLQVDFTGPPDAYQPLKAALDQVLRRPAVLNAHLEASFDPPLPLTGQEVEDLKRRAQDTGPTHCRVELSTEVIE